MPTQVRTFTRPKSLGETLATSLTGNLVANGYSGPSAGEAPIQAPAPTPTTNGEATSRSRSGSDRRRAMYEQEADAKGGITFSHQSELPILPVPDLKNTCRKYLESLRPLQTVREHADTKRAVDAFLREDGPDLQEKLKRYAERRTSYIEEFWYDSYLSFDNPVVLNLNPFFLLEDDPTPARNNQVTRAASLVVSALEFVRAVRKQELPPDKVKDTPLCMDQYRRLFGTARVPTDDGCRMNQDPHSRHIIVLCHGQFYWFDVLDSKSDAIMTEKDIALNLQTIITDAAETPIQEAAKGALGILTSENRKVWSGLRSVLTRDEGSNNADCLGIVDNALFILCLDYSEPSDAAALCGNMLCGTSQVERGVQIGTCTNRWYDKLQIIVCKNGSAGINFEHTGVDGHTVLRFASDVYTDTILRFARTINNQAPTLWATTSPNPSKRSPESLRAEDLQTTPRKLEWDMTPELSIAVRFAETRLADLIGQNEFECLDFSGYGKNFITSMGLSPDAYVQMAFQAAYYGLYGRVECTYEPAMTKFFLHGRTEAIRTVSPESLDFVQTFWADHAPEDKVEALRKACKRHVANTKDCAKALGCDRHLYALLCVWQKFADDDDFDSSDVLAPSSPSAGSGYLSSTGSGPADGVDGDYGTPGRAETILAPSASRRPQSRSRDDSPSSSSSSGSKRSSGVQGNTNHHHGHSAASLPAIFADAGWDRLNTTILSTSNCGNPCLRQFGFGPTSGDGFGVGYIIKDEHISVCASSKHRQTRRFVDALESYLLEMRRILRIVARKNSGGAGTAVGAAAGVASPSGVARDGVAVAAQAGKVAEDDDEARRREERRPSSQARMKSRGRLITHASSGLTHGAGSSSTAGLPKGGLGHGAGTEITGSDSFSEQGMGMSDDDELGGYGFFDAGMLLQALKARNDPAGPTDGQGASPSRTQAQRRRQVGKKLRLIEY